MAYPEKPTPKDRENYRAFFQILPTVLPCEVCQKHFRQHSAHLPIEPALESRQTLVEWLIKIHNMANLSLGKPTMTYESVIEMYKHEYADTKQPVSEKGSTPDNKNSAIYIGVAIVVLLVVFLVWKRRSVLFV